MDVQSQSFLIRSTASSYLPRHIVRRKLVDQLRKSS
jgi:hypothetical protein